MQLSTYSHELGNELQKALQEEPKMQFSLSLKNVPWIRMDLVNNVRDDGKSFLAQDRGATKAVKLYRAATTTNRAAEKKKLRFISANSSWRVLSVSHFRLSAETFPSCLFSYPFVRFNLLLFFINNSSYLCGYDDAICSADVIHNSIAGPIYCHGAADGSMAAWTCKKRRFEKVIRSNSGCKKIRLQFLYTFPGPAWGMDDSPRGRSFTFCLSTSCKWG